SGEQSMVTAHLRATLERQGYRIVGSHSAVKLCRWTKHQLRGRGGCYKHTFYGIESHRCMEFTCCLACANRCVFCWRHQKNPVATAWNWQMDDPQHIVEQAVREQQEMLQIFKGAPDVAKHEKVLEACAVAHCALSLVGEPVLYPRIQELLDQLHSRRISTFLVNNGQFPDQLDAIQRVTQLYLSVDAADPATLKALGRPVFVDYWQRLLASVAKLATNPNRTVFRLTHIKGGNDADPSGYAELMKLGQPSFVEFKGVTFTGVGCGVSMANVPRFDETQAFARAVLAAYNAQRAAASALPVYEVAAVHQHSVSVLLAQTKYFFDGAWHTWIDYDRYFELLARGDATIDELSYSAPTPIWALETAPEQGFDPSQTRHHRNKLRTAVACSETCSCW
uniref:S-adenosyl-L-methionine-dependent tRNA 4-demethylwyosine synthase-like n=1 Tax=Dermatophagoides pteronyssinus TaxID=6956 RepID=A0A6P6Y4E0_DERPT